MRRRTLVDPSGLVETTDMGEQPPSTADQPDTGEEQSEFSKNFAEFIDRLKDGDVEVEFDTGPVSGWITGNPMKDQKPDEPLDGLADLGKDLGKKLGKDLAVDLGKFINDEFLGMEEWEAVKWGKEMAEKHPILALGLGVGLEAGIALTVPKLVHEEVNPRLEDALGVTIPRDPTLHSIIWIRLLDHRPFYRSEVGRRWQPNTNAHNRCKMSQSREKAVKMSRSQRITYILSCSAIVWQLECPPAIPHDAHADGEPKPREQLQLLDTQSERLCAVPLTLGGTTWHVALDTGASLHAFDTSLERHLGIPVKEATANKGLPGEVRVRLFRPP